MEISEQELASLTGDLEEMHHALLPGFQSALAAMAEEVGDRLAMLGRWTAREASRRNFIRGGLATAGTLGAGIAVAACGSSEGARPTGAVGGEGGDLRIARLAASLEVLAVNTYEAALMAVASGTLGKVPPAIATFAKTVKGQHAEHRDNWNALLTKNSRPAQTAPDPKLNGTVLDGLSKAKSVTDIAELALSLENIALQTYVAGAGATIDRGARLISLTIAPVEAQHAAILNFVLGRYPVPDVQVKNDMARSPEDVDI